MIEVTATDEEDEARGAAAVADPSVPPGRGWGPRGCWLGCLGIGAAGLLVYILMSLMLGGRDDLIFDLPPDFLTEVAETAVVQTQLAPTTHRVTPTPDRESPARPLRVVKVAAQAIHPAAKFSGTVSGALLFPLSLGANQQTGEPVTFSVGTSFFSVEETARPSGWSLVGYALVPDASGTGTCAPDLVYGPDNVIPADTVPYLVCIKNSYADP